MKRLALVLSAALELPTAARAQAAPAFPLNSRIRADLVAADRSLFGRRAVQPIAGVLVGADARTLMIVVTPGSDTAHVPLSLLRAVHVSRGMSSRWRAAAVAAIPSGLFAGTMSGLALCISRGPHDPTPLNGALQAAVSSGTIAAVLGAVRPRERWHRIFEARESALAVPLEVRLVPEPARPDAAPRNLEHEASRAVFDAGRLRRQWAAQRPAADRRRDADSVHRQQPQLRE